MFSIEKYYFWWHNKKTATYNKRNCYNALQSSNQVFKFFISNFAYVIHYFHVSTPGMYIVNSYDADNTD